MGFSFHKNLSGFSLVEVIVTVGVIGVIAYGANSYRQNTMRALDSINEQARLEELKNYVRNNINCDKTLRPTGGAICTHNNSIDIYDVNNNVISVGATSARIGTDFSIRGSCFIGSTTGINVEYRRYVNNTPGPWKNLYNGVPLPCCSGEVKNVTQTFTRANIRTILGWNTTKDLAATYTDGAIFCDKAGFRDFDTGAETNYDATTCAGKTVWTWRSYPPRGYVSADACLNRINHYAFYYSSITCKNQYVPNCSKRCPDTKSLATTWAPNNVVAMKYPVPSTFHMASRACLKEDRTLGCQGNWGTCGGYTAVMDCGPYIINTPDVRTKICSLMGYQTAGFYTQNSASSPSDNRDLIFNPVLNNFTVTPASIHLNRLDCSSPVYPNCLEWY